MSFRSSRYLVEQASEQDAEGIRTVFRSGAFDGGIALRYLRDPNPLASFQKEADRAVILVLKDTECGNRIIGVGGCLIRKVFWAGREVPAGYLTGLKIIPEYQKKIRFLPRIYQYIHELTRTDAAVYFTTILSENTAVQKLLEKPRKSMPDYHLLDTYTVFCCKAGTLTKAGGNIRRCTLAEVQDYIAVRNRQKDLSLSRPDAYGLEHAVWYASYDPSGKVNGAGYVLNQQAYKQYVVERYQGIYRFASKLPTRMLGYPAFPRVGQAVNYAAANLWADDLRHAGQLWRFLRADAAEYDFLMLGLFSSDMLFPMLSRQKHISYQSRCYQVVWDQDTAPKNPNALGIDVALL